MAAAPATPDPGRRRERSGSCARAVPMGQGVGRVWRPPAPRDERARPTDPSSTSFDRSGPDKGSSTVQKRFSMMARAVEGAPDCAPHPATRHLISRMRLRARYTGAWQHVPVLQQRRCLRRRERSCRERESSRERRAGVGAGKSSSEAGRAHAGDGGDMGCEGVEAAQHLARRGSAMQGTPILPSGV